MSDTPPTPEKTAHSPDGTVVAHNGTPAHEHAEDTPNTGVVVGGFQFWMIFGSLMVCSFLSALDLTAVSTTLPTIVEDLHGTSFVWVGSAYSLGSTAILPLIGGLAQIFGRRPVVLESLAVFALGSGISGGAKNMNMLIAGRTIQGIGGGGILSMTSIVVADLVPLRKRGLYMGLIGMVWSISAAIGPPVGGAFSQSNWRWLFYMNLPIAGVAMVLVIIFLKLKVPQDDLRTKIRRMDWIGNVIAIGSTTITIVALTWAGVQHPWSSAQVLAPLIIGLAGLGAFLFYEAKFAKEPVVPIQLINNRTTWMGYITVFLHGVVMSSIIYYLPVYFQATLGQGPVKSGVSLFGNAFTMAPAATLAGLSITITGVYRPQLFVGWSLGAIGIGLLTLLKISSPKAEWVSFQVIEGLGLGALFSGPIFPVLAPIPVTENAHALAFFTFVRSYAQTWGVTVGATILQNELKKNLPAGFLDQFEQAGSAGVEIAYAIIPKLGGIPEPVQSQVREAFAESLKTIWYVMIALCGLGFLTVLGMRDVKLSEKVDEDWGMEKKNGLRGGGSTTMAAAV